jgi:hypothetical protein
VCGLDLLNASADRFLTKTRFCEHSHCLIWTAGQSRGGERTHRQKPYGTFWVAEGLVVRAHVYAGCSFGLIPSLKLPDGMNLDHTCENTLCVSPYHLELVTKLENQQRKYQPRPSPTYIQLLLAAGEPPF